MPRRKGDTCRGFDKKVLKLARLSQELAKQPAAGLVGARSSGANKGILKAISTKASEIYANDPRRGIKGEAKQSWIDAQKRAAYLIKNGVLPTPNRSRGRVYNPIIDEEEEY